MIKVGDRLIQARKKLGISLEDASRATKIRAEFLSALEQGNYSKLPSSTYIQGFLRNYSTFLKLPTKETIALFKREFDEREHLGLLPKSFTNPTPVPLFSLRIGNLGIIIVLCILFIVGFIGFEYRAAFINPHVILYQPKENMLITSNALTVQGKTDPNTTVTVNDQQTSIDNNSNFTKTISVFPGDTTIIIKATNSFGRKTTIVRHIVVR